MTSDFRYHVASLSAVFLALGIGILVGTAFVGGKVVERQTALMNRLNANFAELRKETRERELTEQMLQEAAPELIKNALKHQRVLVVQVGAGREAAEQTQRALELAGATVERETLPEEDWQLLASRSNLPRLVVLAGEDSPELARSRDSLFLKALHETGIRTVAVELYEAPLSCVPEWREGADATVDCINRAVGWLALTAALLGENGSFGLKPSATLPPLTPFRPATPAP